MKILFLAHNLGKTRHFEGVLEALTARGHAVVITAAHKRNKPLKLGIFSHNPLIDVVANPVRRVDDWEPFVRPLRQARDYVRYLHPGYGHAHKLTERARAYAPRGWPERLSGNGLGRRRILVKRTLELAESLVPSERYYELFIRSHAPDVILITPLIDFGSYQTDYVKSAHRLGIPIVFLPFSWDNLTNRGLVRIAPDRVLVWNEHQKREAVTYHDVPADRIVITGAPRFDEFFAMRPSTTVMSSARARASTRRVRSFCTCARRTSSRPTKSTSCATGRGRFARTPRSATAASWCVLIRPTPNRGTASTSTDIPNAAVWKEPPKVQADPALYDSLYHCAAVAGLNTSAMIEAGILGKAVHTIQTSEFAGGQEQTLHFHYLLARNGGLVEVAENLQQHCRQLDEAVANPAAGAERSRRFVESFVRPRGLDRPVAPIMVEEIERVATMTKRPHRTPAWHIPAARLLLAALERRGGISGSR